jgi:hypothetical protein
MEKTIRCTVCTWRGPWSDAASVAPPRPSQIPQSLESVQQAIAEKQAAAAQLGSPQPPPCPLCGHLTAIVKLHSTRPMM